MATLVVLAVGWAAVGALWLVWRIAEVRECRSVDRYQASRSVLSAVTVRACPDAPALAAAAPEAHVRIVEGDRAPVVLASRPPARRGRPRRRPTRPGPGGPRQATRPVRLPAPAAPAGGCAVAGRGGEPAEGTEGAAPATVRISSATTGDRPVIRFDDAQPLEPIGVVDPGQPASRARRRGRRLAGQVGALAAVAAAVALLAPPAAAVLGRAGAIPTSGVEVLPGDVPGLEQTLTPVVAAARDVLTLGGGPGSDDAPEAAEPVAPAPPSAPARERPYLEPILTPDVWAPGRSWPAPAETATGSPRS